MFTFLSQAAPTKTLALISPQANADYAVAVTTKYFLVYTMKELD